MTRIYFLMLAAALYAILGLGMLFAPVQFFSPLGITLADGGIVAARLLGAFLTAAGILCWQLRDAELSTAFHASLRALLIFNAIAIVVTVMAMIGGSMSPVALVAVVVQAALAAGFAIVILRSA